MTQRPPCQGNGKGFRDCFKKKCGWRERGRDVAPRGYDETLAHVLAAVPELAPDRVRALVDHAFTLRSLGAPPAPPAAGDARGRDHGGALETAGGIAKALPLLGDAFWVLAGDVFVPSFRFEAGEAEAFRAGDDWGRIWLVPNPPHVPQGDFAVDGAQRVWRKDQAPADARTGTYSTIGLYRPAIVDGVRVGDKAALRPSLERAIDAGRLSARWLEGEWTDVGTPERLAALNAD